MLDAHGCALRNPCTDACPCSRCRAGATPGRSLYEDEEMSDAEIAQLVAALEESGQTAKREAEARQATHVSSVCDKLILCACNESSGVVPAHTTCSRALSLDERL